MKLFAQWQVHNYTKQSTDLQRINSHFVEPVNEGTLSRKPTLSLVNKQYNNEIKTSDDWNNFHLLSCVYSIISFSEHFSDRYCWKIFTNKFAKCKRKSRGKKYFNFPRKIRFSSIITLCKLYFPLAMVLPLIIISVNLPVKNEIHWI